MLHCSKNFVDGPVPLHFSHAWCRSDLPAGSSVTSAMPSTVIRRFAYDPACSELRVEFVTGRCYLYSAVPAEEAARFAAAFAKGVHFNRHIRNRYPCRELAADGAAGGACAAAPIR